MFVYLNALPLDSIRTTPKPPELRTAQKSSKISVLRTIRNLIYFERSIITDKRCFCGRQCQSSSLMYLTVPYVNVCVGSFFRTCLSLAAAEQPSVRPEMGIHSKVDYFCMKCAPRLVEKAIWQRSHSKRWEYDLRCYNMVLHM